MNLLILHLQQVTDQTTALHSMRENIRTDRIQHKYTVMWIKKNIYFYIYIFYSVSWRGYIKFSFGFSELQRRTFCLVYVLCVQIFSLSQACQKSSESSPPTQSSLLSIRPASILALFTSSCCHAWIHNLPFLLYTSGQKTDSCK